MAITIISNFTSGKFYPSANPINCTISSNNSGNCNFRYICDVYVNGIKVFSDKLFPDPSTGYGFFQLSRVLQDYMKTYLQSNTDVQVLTYGADSSAPSSAINVSCKFGEEYDSSLNCTGTVLQYANLSTSATFSVYEAAFDYESYPSYDYTKYLVGTTSNTSTKFLTNCDREVEVTYNDSFSLDFISAQSINTNWRVYYTLYYKDGSAGGNYITPGLTLGTRKRFRIQCGPYDFNRYFDSSIINQDVDYYTIQLRYLTTPVTETFTFKVKDPKEFTTRFSFVGLLGGLEHFTFYHRNRKTLDIQRQTYEKVLQQNYSNNWSYRVGDRGTTTYKVLAQETHAVSTFCSKENSEWLYEMWLSPDVWTYQRPEIINFTVVLDGNWNNPQPGDNVYLQVLGDHQIEAGEEYFIIPEYYAGYAELTGKFSVVSVNGSLINIGANYATYFPPKALCGYMYKSENYSRLPIVISDNQIEVKQKLTRPIEYNLNYKMAYTKNTLRG